MQKELNKWEPRVGLRTQSCYYSTITDPHLINVPGEIIAVGLNYFVLKPEGGYFNVIIKQSDYPKVKNSFNNGKQRAVHKMPKATSSK